MAELCQAKPGIEMCMCVCSKKVQRTTSTQIRPNNSPLLIQLGTYGYHGWRYNEVIVIVMTHDYWISNLADM